MNESATRKQDREGLDRRSEASRDDKEDWIGQQLREVYDKTLNEPIPDRLLDILKQIDKKDSGSK